MTTTATHIATTTATRRGPDVVARAGAVRPLFALTDEELAVLAGPDQGPVAMPHLEALDGELRDVALHTAYRSMLASGLVTPPAGASPGGAQTGPAAGAAAAGAPGDPVPEGDGHWLPVELPAEVDAVLVLRGGAPVLLCLQRFASDQQVLRYVHLVEDVALVEDVLATGLHRFGRVPRPELGACVQQFLVPDDAAPGRGTLTVHTAGAGAVLEPGGVPEEVERLLARATVNADATVRHDGDAGPGELIGMFLGPEGSWVSSNRFGAGGPLTLEPLDPATVAERVLALVTAAEREVGRAGGECVTMSR